MSAAACGGADESWTSMLISHSVDAAVGTIQVYEFPPADDEWFAISSQDEFIPPVV
jgi:hypothetical protein